VHTASEAVEWPEGVPKESTVIVAKPNDGVKRSNDKTIYGADDRREHYEINFQQAKALANGVVSISSMGTAAFPAMGFCSGFLIDKNVIMTAAHCVNKEDYPMKVVRFNDFYISPGEIAQLEYFTIRSVDVWDYSHDFSLISLNPNADGKEAGDKYPTLILSGRARPIGTRLYMIGFPGGEFQKFAPNCSVIRDPYFSEKYGKYIMGVDCDAFGGNSGSPIFDESTHEVVALLWGGQGDTRVFDKATDEIHEYAIPLNVIAQSSRFDSGEWPASIVIKVSSYRANTVSVAAR
jgi:V8-like Glu-specific endopeptidase